MKISTRDKKILLMFLGILIFAASYFFYYRPTMEEVQIIQQENVNLSNRLEELLELAQNKDFYEGETKEMQTKISEYCQKFPYTVRPEDGIVLAMNMEKAMDIKIGNVGLGELEYVYSIDGNAQENAVTLPEETLMEKGNENTQQQINEIEGVEEMPDAIDNSEVDPSNAALESPGADQEQLSPVLYRTKDSMQFQCTYKSLKEMVKYLGSQSGRMTLDNINASFDSTTGNLSGTMTVNLYSMVGGGSTYTAPDAGRVKLGTKNIFGTIEKTTKKKQADKKANNK